MTETQIEQLRQIIKGEIEYALLAERDFWNSFDQEKLNNKMWTAFKESFTVSTD